MSEEQKPFFNVIQEFIETVINPQMKVFAEKSIEKYGEDTVKRFMIQTDVYELIPIENTNSDSVDVKVN